MQNVVNTTAILTKPVFPIKQENKEYVCYYVTESCIIIHLGRTSGAATGEQGRAKETSHC